MSDEKIAYHLTFTDVIRLLRLIDEAPFRELELEIDGLKLRVVNDREPGAPVAPATAAAVPAPPPVAAPAPAVPAPAAARPQKPGTPVVAPLAGTFYRAPLPGEPPFVEVGKAVNKGDVVGIIEIMKLMNHVTAPCSGVVVEICAGNEEFVEYGHVLAVIDPRDMK